MIDWTKKTYDWFDRTFPKLAKVARYLVAGGTAAATDLALLFVLTHYFDVWYVASAAIAFVIAFFVSFYLQKFWTFRDHSTDGIHRQGAIYFLVAAANLGINTALVFTLTEKAGLHYMLSQVIASALIAFESYFIYHFLIFKRSHAAPGNPLE